MALTKISRSLLDTGVSDSSDATAITIDSSERVGINGSPVYAKLHVYGGSGNGTDLATAATNAKVAFRNTSSSSLTSNEGYTGNSWYKQISNGSGTTAYDLSLNPFGGKVSVGTDDPSAIFQIHGGSTDYDPSSTGTGLFHVTAGATSNYTGYIGISDSGMSVGHNGGGSRYLRFDTNETERMRINSSGHLLVGTTTEFSGTTANLTVPLAIDLHSNDANLKSLTFGRNAAEGEIGGIAAKVTGFGSMGRINFVAEDVIGGQQSSSIRFKTTAVATEREVMRLDQSGRLLLGTTTVNIDGSSGTGVVLRDNNSSLFTVDGDDVMALNRLGTDGTILRFRNDGTSVGYIATGSNSLPSDRNFKRDIEDLEVGLDLIKKLKPAQYNYKIQDDDAPKLYGLIAQDLEQSLTEVGVEKNSTSLLQHNPNDDEKESDYHLDYLKLTPVLINAIQEQQEQIEALQSEINLLKGE